MTFESMALSAPIQRALEAKNYTAPSPIQLQTIPHVLDGRDVLGCAQTGTGKTAAFALPILERLHQCPKEKTRGAPRALILAPTRELAAQIKASFDAYGARLPHRAEAVFGGVSAMAQVRAMQRGPEILVATPGRLLDLIRGGHVSLRQVEIFVMDEADRMLDMGFLPDVNRIIKLLPERRQTLFFSATMPPDIQRLAEQILRNPERVEVTPTATTVDRIDQSVCHVPASRRKEMLVHLLRRHSEGLVLIFSSTKHGANRIAQTLEQEGVPAEAIHGNKSQAARQRALEGFRQGRTRVLVATDIASRGIDVKGIALVVNYDLPKEPEAYVHRIGRTARAGADGRAISLCSEQEVGLLRRIERTIRQTIPVEEDHPFVGAAPTPQATSKQPKSAPARNSRPSGARFGRRRVRRAGVRMPGG